MGVGVTHKAVKKISKLYIDYKLYIAYIMYMTHIDLTQPCWPWHLYITEKGYGRIKINGKPYRAHRLIYEALIGDIPEGLTLDHLCRFKACVNPAHLEPVTNEENVRRSWQYRPKKLICLRGHPITGANEMICKNGNRRCRACHNSQRSRKVQHETI